MTMPHWRRWTLAACVAGLTVGVLTVTADDGSTSSQAEGCEVEVPDGTQFGASISTIGRTPAQAMEEIDEAVGKVPVVRLFSSEMPKSWDSTAARAVEGRTLVTSFRAHPADVLAGTHDAYLREWFREAPEDVTIYWIYYHEPESRVDEGLFTASQYRAAWQHLAGLADETCKPNMLSTLVLTSWTSVPDSGRDWADYDAGPEVVDVVAWDPYNGVAEPSRDYYESPEVMLGTLVDIMGDDGRPWGIAEIGSRIIPSDITGEGRATWLHDVGDYLRANDASFMTYYQLTHEGDWWLYDEPSRQAYRDLVTE